jgi:hypothetical protein
MNINLIYGLAVGAEYVTPEEVGDEDGPGFIFIYFFILSFSFRIES